MSSSALVSLMVSFTRKLCLTLKAPIMTAADDIDIYFSLFFRENKTRQRIHMKNQALFSLKDKSKKLKCRLLQISFGALRVTNISLLHKKIFPTFSLNIVS